MDALPRMTSAARPAPSTFFDATVTAVGPLRIRLDGDSTALSFAPDSLLDPATLTVGDRVRCEWSNGRIVIHGVAGGAPSPAYLLRETVYFVSSDTFSKADYPWLKAVRVRVVGGGGAGGSSASPPSGEHSQGGGGGGGAFAEAFITDIAGLGESVSVTVGDGGKAVAGVAGNAGGQSSFGSAVVAGGGGGGGGNVSSLAVASVGGSGGAATAGDLMVSGGAGGMGTGYATLASGAPGGQSVLGGGGRGIYTGAGSGSNPGAPGGNYGGGGGGAASNAGGDAQLGGAGAPGIVILELFS